ncbi:hypothetical protein OEA41_007782 [Lepraria neglecta]|uniref:Leo1-like protein n=1 Tax=Lepraria neglecta TaxID=209136 RepID=A0AAE0DNE7_9LECA|nr:hypothetical protein OEA41_007782 [Lepraria neglecta]
MSSDQDASVASDQEQLDDQLNEEDAGGLFGSGSEDEGSGADSVSNKRRKLDDEDLDSGDDGGRRDRLEDGAEGDGKGDELYEHRANILATSIGRHPGPRPSDGELYLLQLPNFIGIEPKAFTLKSFQPPKTDHHSSGPPSATFSAYHTSNNTVRWRHAPNDLSTIQSNARILRWSDGSLTLQFASNPREQFELTAKPLAPPQTNPAKPTPTSVNQSRSHGSAGYNARLDSHTYLAAPHESAELIRLTNHITASLAVQSSTDQDDEALARLQEQLAAAQKGNKTTQDGGVAVINISEDPEMAKKRAELAEKEKSKMQRRMQIQADRETNRNNNVLKRSGLRTGMGAGLTIGGLEDDDGMGTTRGRPSKPKSRRPRRRNSEYSDDEEFRGRGRTREDEYDEDDGFLVASDEEPEVGEESEEEAEMGSDGAEEEVEKPKKRGSEEAAGGGRAKRRRVIEDEDED